MAIVQASVGKPLRDYSTGVDEGNEKPSMVPCAHCGLPAASNLQNSLAFCCHGCQGAYALIHEMGFDDYYALRDAQPSVDAALGSTSFTSAEATSAAVDLLSDLEEAGVPVRHTVDGLNEVCLGIEGLHCAACSWLIERMQGSIDGVKSAQVRWNDRSLRLIYDPERTSPSKVARRLAKLGYLLVPLHDEEGMDAHFRRQQREHLIAIATAAFLAANAMWIGIALYAGEASGILASHEVFLKWLGTGLAVVSAILPGRLFFESAWQALRTRTAHVDIPVALAIGMGIAGSIWGTATGRGDVYFDSLASLILLLRVGRFIQFRSQRRTSLSLTKLFRWRNAMAHRFEEDGSVKPIAASRLRVGDRVVVQPGQSLPSDGTVTRGESHLNVAWLTGESQPQRVAPGDQVVGGTINIDSPIEMRITECGRSSRLGQLEEVIRNAAGERTPLVRAADRIGSWFVVIVLALAVVCWGAWWWLEGVETATLHTIALLTIACPCAIALAAPLVITVAIGRAAKNQIWIRDGECLERLAVPGTMWFDKTGTLTEGELRVVATAGDEGCLAHALAVEQAVQHPVAQALRDHASHRCVLPFGRVSGLQLFEGQGVAGDVDGSAVLVGSERFLRDQGATIDGEWEAIQSSWMAKGWTTIWVAIDLRVEGLFAIGDRLRYDAIPTLQELQAQGWKLGILSGDRQGVVDYWREELHRNGICLLAANGDCSPESKVQVLRGTPQRDHSPTVFVGDGMNDAAALSIADVGMAIQGGSELSLRNAPIYLANQRLASIVRLTRAARSSLRTIHRCFAISLLYNTITISLAMVGWIHPLIAALFMPLSGISVLLLALSGKTFPAERGKP